VLRTREATMSTQRRTTSMARGNAPHESRIRNHSSNRYTLLNRIGSNSLKTKVGDLV